MNSDFYKTRPFRDKWKEIYKRDLMYNSLSKLDMANDCWSLNLKSIFLMEY